MDSIVAQVKLLAQNADESTRIRILDQLREVSLAIEEPQDTMQRLSYLHLQPALVRVGIDLKLFNILHETKHPLTVDELSVQTSAAPLLLGRILRYLASVGAVKEVARDIFTANNITTYLSSPGVCSALYHHVDNIAPAVFALPEFLALSNYQDITSPTNTPLQKAWNTNLPVFLWMQTKPENHAHFNRYMEAQREGTQTWLDVYPIEDIALGLGVNQPLFVDVGGGIGHQSVALAKRLPDVTNEIILQDLEAVVGSAIPHDGVEVMACDFFKPQSVQGARIYYLRNIIHDYPDDKAVLILQNLLAALGPDSIILIDDIVLPDVGVHWHAAQIDIAMMAALASQERTLDQWHSLLEKAGLEIREIYTYAPRLDSILECVPVVINTPVVDTPIVLKGNL